MTFAAAVLLLELREELLLLRELDEELLLEEELLKDELLELREEEELL